jgi:hypothetical protein
MAKTTGKVYKYFKDWFDPYDKQHVQWAMEYLSNPLFDWEKVIPENVVPCNDYGMREYILNAMASCWILFTIHGLETPPVTH